MPSHRKGSNGMSPSSSEEGGFLTRWRRRRLERKIYKAIFVALEEHMDAGLPVSDFFVFYIEEAVEWDRSEQCWIVKVASMGELVLDAGMRVNLARGRGDAEESARILEVLGDFVDVRSGNSGVIYKLEFE